MKKTATRVFAILLAALLLCGIVPLSAAAEGTDITAAFTDPAFRAAVQELVGKDVILDTDVAGVETLDVCGKTSYDQEADKWISSGEIRSLAGLEHFTALQGLYCHNNKLTALPALPSNLRALGCDYNQITALPALPDSLINLYCSGNQLTELPKLPAGLYTLHCNSNQLTELPALPANTLRGLDCGNNQLTVLPVLPSGLKILWCSENQLTSLDVTGLQLVWLDCRYNNMLNRSSVKGFVGTWLAFDPSGLKYNFYPQNPIYFWSSWPPALQWAIEYILFGWLWMRWA
ncbi:MAG: leucine-rich repeat domain-containing protein [Oscillospiraceae bacterium]|nr:leucine-rich repeat domain-containing protein [Oscillospiraceae bacterium]